MIEHKHGHTCSGEGLDVVIVKRHETERAESCEEGGDAMDSDLMRWEDDGGAIPPWNATTE